MKVHRGEILKKAIDAQDISIMKICKNSGVKRASLYRSFDKENVDLDVIIKVGRVIDYDFSKEIPEIKGVVLPEDENLNYKMMYYDLMESTKNLMEELIKLKKNPNKKSNTKTK